MNLEQIDTSTTSGKAQVMQLAAAGRDVAESTLVHGPLNNFYSKWSATSFPAWDWRNCNYAIIAEPFGPDEVWVVLNPAGCAYAMTTHEPSAIYPGETLIRYVRAGQ